MRWIRGGSGIRCNYFGRLVVCLARSTCNPKGREPPLYSGGSLPLYQSQNLRRFGGGLARLRPFCRADVNSLSIAACDKSLELWGFGDLSRFIRPLPLASFMYSAAVLSLRPH